MQQAFRKGDKAKLTQLLPSARGHVLEPWAAYWELKARLDEASADEILGFFKRWPGTYQEDRLRNDWLLLLGQRRDWGMFDQVHGAFRMRDDRSVSCYALLIDSIKRSEEHTSELQSPCNLVCRLLLEKKKKAVRHLSVRDALSRSGHLASRSPRAAPVGQ